MALIKNFCVKMKISINKICSFTQSSPCRNFLKGERALNANHEMFYGKKKSADKDCINFTAVCLQTWNMPSTHEIVGSISHTGKIIDIKCSCKAELSKNCKHSVAVVLQ